MKTEKINKFYVKIYKLNKIFDYKMFDYFGQFEFWVNQMTIPIHLRQKNKHQFFINKLEVFEVSILTGELRLLSTYIFEEDKFKNYKEPNNE